MGLRIATFLAAALISGVAVPAQAQGVFDSALSGGSADFDYFDLGGAAVPFAGADSGMAGGNSSMGAAAPTVTSIDRFTVAPGTPALIDLLIDGPAIGNGVKPRAPTCDGMTIADLTQLFRATRVDGAWSRASGVMVQPVALCPDVRAWASARLNQTRLGATLRAAVAADPLVSTSLSRTSYGPEQVLAVKQSGSQLVVYVY